MHLKIVDLSNACRSWKINCSILFNLNLMTQTARTWQKLKKYIVFNTFLIKILKEKNRHKHQDPKIGKSKISILFWWENTPRSWQKLENQNFNTFLFRTLIGRSSHKHQDPGKSWKNQKFNTFLIRILIEKSSHKHQDPAKSWKNQNFNTILMRKNTKILAKAGKNKIAILFI